MFQRLPGVRVNHAMGVLGCNDCLTACPIKAALNSPGMPSLLNNQQILFKQDPGRGWVEETHMELSTVNFDLEQTLAPGSVLVKNLYLSVDPYMRGRMNTTAKSYIGAFVIGEPLQGGGIAQVVKSNRDGLVKGDIVSTFIPWSEYAVLPKEANLLKVNPIPGLPLSYFLGILGMPGMTAYAGLLDIGLPKEGETVFVSGAAGAVGLVVGQIAKIKGCRVVGSAGSDEKVKALVEEFGFDAAFNYKTTAVAQGIAELCPKGIDVYFDNVGGETLDAVLVAMNKFGRIIACGMVSQYNATQEQAYGIKNLMMVIGKEIKIEGFIVSSRMNPEFFQRFHKDMTAWISQGQLKYTENVVQGIDNAPKAFIGMLKGANTGKQIVEIHSA